MERILRDFMLKFLITKYLTLDKTYTLLLLSFCKTHNCEREERELKYETFILN